MTEFLDRTRGEIAARMAQLSPLVEEYHQLRRAASALEVVGGPNQDDEPVETGRAQSPASTRAGRAALAR